MNSTTLALLGLVLGFAATRLLLPSSPDPAKKPDIPESRLPGNVAASAPATYFDRRLTLERDLRAARTPESMRACLARMEKHGAEIRYTMGRWASTDPEAFIAFAAAVGTGNEWVKNAIHTAFDALWEKDPSRAEALAAGFPGKEGRASALSSVIRNAISQGDPEEAKRLVVTYSSHVSDHFYAVYPEIPLEKIATALSHLPDTDHSIEIAHGFTRTWAAKDPVAAVTWIKAYGPGKLRETTLGYLLSDIADRDPAKASEILAEIQRDLPDWEPWGRTLVKINEERFKDDPAGGIRWANQNLSLSDRGEYFQALTQSVIQNNGLESAMALLPDVPPGQRGPLLNEIARTFANRDPAAGLAWLESQPPSPATGAALKALSYDWAAHDLESARTYLTNAASTSSPELREPIVTAWATQDPQAAIAWARDLPPDQSKSAHETAVLTWSKNHPQPAADYALTLPEGELRASLLYYTGTNLLRADLTAGETWLRELRTDAEKIAGRQAIAGSYLSEAQQKSLRDRLGL